jgi:hypothetical protein
MAMWSSKGVDGRGIDVREGTVRAMALSKATPLIACQPAIKPGRDVFERNHAHQIAAGR